MPIERQNTPSSELNGAFRASAMPLGMATGTTSAVHSTPEGWATDAEGGGLVQYKTSPTQQVIISFKPTVRAARRLSKLKRNTYLAGQLHSIPRPGFRPDQAWLITPTYDTKGTLGRGCHNWAPDHMSNATDRYRDWCKSRGHLAKYTWVAELTAKGTVHYHLVAWLPQGTAMPHWDRAKGQRKPFWTHGMTETAKLKTNCSYLMKYLSKMGEHHRFPHGLRLSGNGGLDAVAKQIRSWHNLPQWVKTEYGVGEVARKKYGITDLSTGEILAPMYSRKYIPGGILLTQLRDMPERWQISGNELFFGPYSTWPRDIP